MYYVYILKLDNGEFYTGFTKDLKDRIEHHKHKSTKYTRDHVPQELAFYASFSNKQLALDFEIYLKSSSGKAFRNKRLI